MDKVKLSEIEGDKCKFVTVYMGSSYGNKKHFKLLAFELAEGLVQMGKKIVYGGANFGLMGEVADTALACGGEVYGVFPCGNLVPSEQCHDKLTEITITDTMAERKTLLIKKGDIICSLPGGAGTMEEVTEVISQKNLGHHTKPLLLLNINNFYDPIIEMYKKMEENGFMKKPLDKLFECPTSVDDMLKRIKELSI